VKTFVGCTASTVSHLPRARVAAESWRNHHPESPFVVLLIDGQDWAGESESEPFEIVSLEELGLSADELAVQQGIYDVYEFACAVEPHLLRLLLNRGASAVVFTDTDTCFYGPVDDLGSAAEAAGLVLLPASIRPANVLSYFPADQIGRRQRMNGLFNTGLLAAGRSADDGFLEWWAGWLARDCLREPSAGMWVDQLWLDWAPVYFEHLIMRDSSLNVGYWNLDERALGEVDGRPTIDRAALRHFHFVGFDPCRPEVLSVYSEDLASYSRDVLGRDLPSPVSNPALSRLLQQYSERLLGCGSEELRARPYPFDVSAGGRKLGRRERAVYREAVLAAEARGMDPPPNPFDSSRTDEFERLIDAPGSLRTLSPQAQKRLELVRPAGVSPSSVRRGGRRLLAAARYALTEQAPPELKACPRVASDTIRLEYTSDKRPSRGRRPCATAMRTPTPSETER
jgi:hypothetical protein